MTVWFLIIGLMVVPHAYQNKEACLAAMGQRFIPVSQRVDMHCEESGPGYRA